MICSDDPRAQAMRPAGPVLETRYAFAFVAPEPFPDGRRRNTYGAGYGARRFARSERCDNQDSHVRRRPGILVNVTGGSPELVALRKLPKPQFLPGNNLSRQNS
jgi:hypothetical protein